MDTTHTIFTKSSKETQEFGQKMADSVMPPAIFCLYGELGSGKTTFTQGFAKGLGISTRLLSPTFIIVRRYSMKDKKNYFYHIDLYRIKNMNELDGLGLREIFSDPHAIICIEWAQRLGTLLPKERMDIHFLMISNEERKIIVSEHSENSENQKVGKLRKPDNRNF